MSLDIEPCGHHGSLSLWAFQTLLDRRNGYIKMSRGYCPIYRKDMGCCEIFLFRTALGLACPFLLVAGIVESLFRTVVGYMLALFECLCIAHEEKSEFQSEYSDHVWGALGDVKAPVLLLIAGMPFATLAVFITNFFMEHIEFGSMYQGLRYCCPCLPSGE